MIAPYRRRLRSRRRPLAAEPASATLFTAGVASGDVTAAGLVLWTRARPSDGSDVRIDWSVRQPGGPVLRSGSALASRAGDHTVHVRVDGLEPATDLEYEFRRDRDRIVGRTRTLPDRADRFRFAVVCCSRWGWPGFELFDAVVDDDPDLVLHLGDSIYEIGERPPSGVDTDPPWECETLDDYRRRYRQSRSHPSLRRLHGNRPVLAVWDDHEVVDNAPDPDGRSRRRAGQQAWAEWMPVEPADRTGPLDRTVSIDGLIDLALIDTRFAGRTPADTDGPATGAAPGTLLDDRQWDRLADLAATSGNPWFVVANQVQVGPMVLAHRPAIHRPRWRAVINPDQWDGYPDDRDRLYRLLRTTSGRPVVLSGDLHSGWSRTLFDGDRALAHEFTSPSISGLTFANAVQRRLPIPARLLAWWLRRLNPGIDHLDVRRHGYLVCDVTPAEFRTTFVTTDGERLVRSLRTR